MKICLTLIQNPGLINTMSHESSFNIRTARDFLHEIVIPQHDDFIANNSSSRHALLTILVSYHLYEWVHPQEKFSKDHFSENYKNELGMADIFELARGISNGTKHFLPKATTRTQTGFSSAFSEAFARPLNVEFPKDTVDVSLSQKSVSVDLVLSKIVEFWKKQEKRSAF